MTYSDSTPIGPFPYGYCWCGCGEKTRIAPETDRRHGYVKGEPLRYIRGHRNRGLRQATNRPMYIVNEGTGCWEWQRAKNPQGYGSLRVNGVWTKAHRHFFEQYKGAIPDGYVIDHLCRNPSCVNPDHLDAVPQKVNVNRGLVTKIPREDVDIIRDLLTKHSQSEVATMYGVGREQISRLFGERGKPFRNPYRGVYPTPHGTFVVRIRHNGRQINLGTFRSAEEGARIYNQKAKELHGDQAVLNDVD